jgi:hypothetical protein
VSIHAQLNRVVPMQFVKLTITMLSVFAHLDILEILKINQSDVSELNALTMMNVQQTEHVNLNATNVQILVTTFHVEKDHVKSSTMKLCALVLLVTY